MWVQVVTSCQLSHLEQNRNTLENGIKENDYFSPSKHKWPLILRLAGLVEYNLDTSTFPPCQIALSLVDFGRRLGAILLPPKVKIVHP